MDALEEIADLIYDIHNVRLPNFRQTKKVSNAKYLFALLAYNLTPNTYKEISKYLDTSVTTTANQIKRGRVKYDQGLDFYEDYKILEADLEHIRKFYNEIEVTKVHKSARIIIKKVNIFKDKSTLDRMSLREQDVLFKSVLTHAKRIIDYERSNSD